MDSLNPSSLLPPSPPISGPARLGVQADGGGVSFSDILTQAIREAGEADEKAEGAVRNLLLGDATDMHSAILAVQQADVSMMMMMAVRSKLIDAYREVMRMPM